MASVLPPEAAEDVHRSVSTLETLRKKSKFDELLEERWKRAPLWYTLGALPNKRLEGNYGFVVELNEQRATKRRKAEDIQSIRQPFDPSRFNFNKVNDREILFRDNENALIANVAPLGPCQTLVVPSVSACLPQILTAAGLNLTLDLMFRSGSPDLRGGFNSLGAYASVNHQHLHLYYVRHRMLLETIFAEPIGPKLFSLSDYPARGLLLAVTFDDRSSVELLLHVTDLLLDSDIVFNIFLTRGSAPGVRYFCAPTTYEVIRIYLWARKPRMGVKDSTKLNLALSELGGHIPVKSQEAYDSISEKHIVEEQKLLCDEPFEQMRKLLQDNKLLFP
ncbi:GDP-D-glucose phosphorylase 1 [Galendromus occidentalis]|uniref:GDP-D-glucose phosphorylase 1 n=1 Tax=Galendromus occidentalis TaxID=34638 RepID=A0AAJ7PAG3_9ACAR|nr:GDP-D-glucose phosphorylase 1 [Galendromus occidentalis]